MDLSDNKSILIVDDVSKNIQVLATYLKQEGYKLNFAQNGQEALKHAQRQPFDLILLDIMMPEMDGFEVCRQIKKNKTTSDIPIIFITAKSDIESVTRSFEAGGVDYITKPFNGAELIARVKTHLNLKDKEMKLMELNETKDKFFSIIAHDLRNPFFNLMGLSDLLGSNINDYSQDEIVDIANAMSVSAKQGYDLLENLLDWSLVQSGRISYMPEKVNLLKVAKTNAGLFESNIRVKNIGISLLIDKELKVYADENMITTVLRNLISNAIKFSVRGSDVVIDAVRKDNEVLVSVTDQGTGISKENLDKLFKISTKVSVKGTENESGTGLGLVLCKEFVELNGGKIWAETKLGKGTTMRFTLPVDPPKNV
jgi:two-component system, sensor histidine kinase and response regulator